MNINLKPLAMLILLSIAACHQSTDSNKPKLEEQAETHIGDNYKAGRDININYQKSEDYQDLITQRDKLRDKVKQYPDDADFPKNLAEIESNITAFEHDVLQLAETLNSVPINSKHLNQATAYFQAGEFEKARDVLNIDELTKDQDTLLRQQEVVKTKLRANAVELMILAQTTAIDYKLGEQRLPKTQAYFEQALKSNESSYFLFNYANVLQKNNQFKLAEHFYRVTLNV